MPPLVALAASELQPRTGAAGSGRRRLCPGRRRGEARRGEARPAQTEAGRGCCLPPSRLQVGAVEGPPPARGWSRLLPRLPPPRQPPSGKQRAARGSPAFASRKAAAAAASSLPASGWGGMGGGQEPPRARGELRSSPLPPSRRRPTSPPRGSAAGCRCLSWKPLSDPPPPPTPGGADSLPGAGRPPWPPAGPRRGEREVRGCGRRGRRAGPSPSPGGLPPRRGAPGGPKRKLAVLPVLPPGPAGAHHRPGGRRKPRPGSAGAGVGAGGSPPGRLRARVLPGSPRPPQRLSQRQTSEVRALLWPRLDNIAGVAAPGGARHPNYLSHKIKDPWGGRGWSVVHCRLF